MASQLTNLLQKALQAIQNNEFIIAKEYLNEILLIDPGRSDAMRFLGVIAALEKNWSHALDYVDEAIKLDPKNGFAHSNRGNILLELGKKEEALCAYEKAILFEPLYAEAYNNGGNIYQALKRYQEALACYAKAIALQPGYSEAFANQGNAFQNLGRYQEALSSYEKAVTINPKCAPAFYGVARLFLLRNQYSDAFGCCEQALKIDPCNEDALRLKGDIFFEIKDYQNALAVYNKLLIINTNLSDVWFSKGQLYSEMKEFDLAHDAYQKTLQMTPNREFLLGMLVQNGLQMCSWSALKGVGYNKKVAIPYNFISIKDDKKLIKKSLEIYAKSLQGNIKREVQNIDVPNKKIRLGYFSADFHNHPTAYLIAELFECHNKEEFELIAFVFGRNTPDEMRARLQNSFDRFIDLNGMTDQEAAKLSRDMQIDIAIDLKGYTKEARPRIFMYGAAPIQVSYLAFPGTMGSDSFDYVIADLVVIPNDMQDGFSEKVIYLPNSYQVNDRNRKISSNIRSRKQFGLPDSGFIYCSFNNNYKITADTFDGWIRILSAVQDSVLWLYEDNRFAKKNLIEYAKLRGLDASRLIFAGPMELADHLARYRIADLFLDTSPCNAHTTASDALWAGLPLLTTIGKSFAARVAASLLSAVGLPDMIANSQKEYEEIAIELGKNPAKLGEIKSRLESNLLTKPLFDTPQFTKHLEAGYKLAYRRHLNKLAPDHLYVS